MRISLTISGILLGTQLLAQNAVVTNLGALPAALNECSGIVNDGQGRFWMHSDSYNESKFYLVDTTRTILRTINVINAQNIDWEDIAIDPDGNVYLADIGNNNNDRTDLRILKVSADQLAGADTQGLNAVAEPRFKPLLNEPGVI